MAQPGALFQEAKHGTNFASRATRDVNEAQEFISGATLEALGDVVRNGKGGPLKLIAKAGGEAFFVRLNYVVDSMSQAHRLAPDREFLKAGVGHKDTVVGSEPNFKFEI